MEPRRRSERAIVAVVPEAYVNGVSTRRTSGASSPSTAPISSLISASINSWHTNATASPAVTRLRNDIGNRHALTIGHRGVLLHVDCGTADEFGATVADPSQAPTYQALATPLLLT